MKNSDNDAHDKKLALKNNAPFFNCVLKINNTLIGNAENLDVVMPMYNLLYYPKNYRKTTGTLWNYYRDEPNSGYNITTEMEYIIQLKSQNLLTIKQVLQVD